MKTKKSLHKLMIEGSRDRKSLSGAIKISKACSVKFWNEAGKVLKKSEVNPAWIVKHAKEEEKFLVNKEKEFKLNKNGAKIQRENWSAWAIEKIIRRYVLENEK